MILRIDYVAIFAINKYYIITALPYKELSAAEYNQWSLILDPVVYFSVSYYSIVQWTYSVSNHNLI